MKVRVIRLLEYEYDSLERAEADSARWTRAFDIGNSKMRSTELGPYPITNEEQT